MNLKNLSMVAAGAAFVAQLHSFKAEAATINQVNPGELTVTGLLTFDDDVAGGEPPGTNYDAIFESNGANFAERFVGQTLSVDEDFDILSGTPTGLLALQAGSLGQNLDIFANEETLNTNALTGLGPSGFPKKTAIGEGSFAVLFDFDQSEFGFDLVGGDGGSATVSFFRRNGSLIETVVLNSLNNTSYGFSSDGGKEIAGFSIYNTDEAGIGFDNLRSDISVVPSAPTPGSDIPLLPSAPTPGLDVPPVSSAPNPGSDVPLVPSDLFPGAVVPNVPSATNPCSDVPLVPSEPTPIPFEFSPGLGILILGAWGAIAQLKSRVQKKSSKSQFSNK